MGDVTAVMMDVITEKSGHTITPMAVSVCITPAAPSPLPIPYPVVGSVSEGVGDPAMRTKINGSKVATVGSVIKTCHGNEPGTLKEVVSLNTAGPCFIIMGAPIVFCELGMMGITTSACISNKAPTPGAGGSASGAGGAGGAGGGAGGGGSPNASDGSQPDAANGGGGGGDGTNEGATADPATAPPRYCPDPNRSAPPPFEADIEDSDLRNRHDAIISHGTPAGREAARRAMYGQPGGATPTQGQAFWSGGGLAAAREDGFGVQEDRGGAQGLQGMGDAGRLPDWRARPDGSFEEAGDGSGITNARLWRTVSRRSAEEASGTVDAFVVGSARPGNVFAAVELPTLLHNPDVTKINFRDPTATPPRPVAQEWNRNPTDGCWEGGSVGSGGGPHPGFSLHPTDGFTRP